MYKFIDWPGYESEAEAIAKLSVNAPLSLDLEWDINGSPTILGLSDGVTHVSVPFSEGLPYLREILRTRPATQFSGHNVIGADLFVLDKMGVHIPVVNAIDSIIYHWLVNMNLCKSSSKIDEEDGDPRGRGWMNLGTFATMYTDLALWKYCRGAACTGPCPEHQKYWYNALDSASVALALPKVMQQARLRGVDRLYPMHRDLAWELAGIQEAGIRIDVPFVYPRAKHRLGSEHGASLDETFRNEKDRIKAELPFNPQSPKAIVEYFKVLKLPDAQEETIRETVEELNGQAPAELVALLAYKELGNGCDRWYLPQYRDDKGWVQGYLDDNGYIHPRTGFFTSSGRLMQSGPNMQNIGKRRVINGQSVGKLVRRAVIAPPDHYIVRADLSNAEGRTILYHAGYREVPSDIHSWMETNIGLKPEDPICKALGGPRDAAKSVVHASNYLEGLQLKDKADLRSPRMRKEIEYGARVVFWDWTFKGKIVTFTGVNLARRAFGDATHENRKRALDVMTRYIDQSFPDIRKFHRRVSKQVETEGAVRTLHGYVLLSYGPDPADQLKTAVAVWGQQTTAHLNKLGVLDVQRKFHAGRPMQVFQPMHDELLCYVHDSVPPAESMAWMKESMELELPEMIGLQIPADPSWGHTWADQNKK